MYGYRSNLTKHCINVADVVFKWHHAFNSNFINSFIVMATIMSKANQPFLWLWENNAQAEQYCFL